ncbi:FtsK/SpoIIIE domain-containing protein [Nesterenkonia pannonica]|uniref:FtsK/SpoIIIE domain-containing protein n=1 Tax=Nesterenkonia pannonica TaxID=1548602 RepID=UPI002164390C|nr:FtsK/SpoIIIE domain-containing protein [Nesterenkonia pannonica]
MAELGQGRSGPTTLDLVGDGPHLLIGGTTGSGKSELVKTLMLSLACRYGPEELNCILFDFKGGATFHQLNQLEHSLGLVTDLSQAQAERTLESIRSELIRREKLFLDADAGDYGEYRSLRPELPLARIVVVIDEFRIFAHELPETMDELMRIATLGRSLGLHLILSTQRPQGL